MNKRTKQGITTLAMCAVTGLLLSSSLKVNAAGVTSGKTPTVAPAAATATPTTNGVSVGPLRGLSLTQAQSHAEGELSSRLTKLAALQTRVNGSSTVTSSDKASIDSIIAFSTAGMHTLYGDVQNDTTVVEVWDNEITMVQDYRVWVVVAPQIDLSLTNDMGSAVTTKLANLEPSIQTIINQEQQAGKSVASAEAAFAGYKSQISIASGALDTVSSPALLSETPADYPGCSTLFKGSLSNLQTAHAALSSAKIDLQQIIADLK